MRPCGVAGLGPYSDRPAGMVDAEDRGFVEKLLAHPADRRAFANAAVTSGAPVPKARLRRRTDSPSLAAEPLPALAVQHMASPAQDHVQAPIAGPTMHLGDPTQRLAQFGIVQLAMAISHGPAGQVSPRWHGPDPEGAGR